MRSWFVLRQDQDSELIAATPAFTGVAKSALVVGAVLFAFFGVAHLLVLDGSVGVPMAIIAFASSGTLAAVRLGLYTGYLPFHHIRHALFLVGFIGWCNSSVHLFLSADPMQLTNLAIVAMLCGTILVSRIEFITLLVASVLTWLGVLVSVATLGEDPRWVHYSVFLGQAWLLSCMLFYWRRRELLRNVDLQKERSRARTAEHLSLLAAQSKAIEAERNLRRALEADAAKSMFLANMSHELRTPLNSVVGFAQLLRDRPELASRPELVKEYADCIQTSGLHLLGLINQILDLSRANAGGIKLHETSVDLGETVEEITRLLAPQASGTNVGLQAHIGPGTFVMRGDDLRIRQIVTNLVANAVKFTPAGGRVDVTGGVEAETFYFAVKDTGVGIATQDLARIFDPFVQADSGLNKRHQGTGLGLAITRKLVELHGGTITLKSSVGEGSVFTVRFPLERLEQDRQRRMA